MAEAGPREAGLCAGAEVGQHCLVDFLALLSRRLLLMRSLVWMVNVGRPSPGSW